MSWREAGYARRSRRRLDVTRPGRFRGSRIPRRGDATPRPWASGESGRPAGRGEAVDARFDQRHWFGRTSVRDVATFPAAIASFWRRSLQARVAVTTLLVTGVFVFVVGLFLVNKISSGVLAAKRHGALVQADAGTAGGDQEPERIRGR